MEGWWKWQDGGVGGMSYDIEIQCRTRMVTNEKIPYFTAFPLWMENNHHGINFMSIDLDCQMPTMPYEQDR